MVLMILQTNMKVLLVVVAVLVLGDCLPFNNINFKKLLSALSNSVKTENKYELSKLDDASKPQNKVQVLFEYTDKDYNGKLSVSEIASLMVAYGQLTHEEATLIGDTLVRDGGINGDNQLNKNETLYALPAATKLVKSSK